VDPRNQISARVRTPGVIAARNPDLDATSQAVVDESDDNAEDEPIVVPSVGDAMAAVETLQHYRYLFSVSNSNMAQKNLVSVQSLILNVRRHTVQSSVTDLCEHLL